MIVYKKRKYSGRGFFDTLFSAMTSSAAKEVATTAAKSVAAELGKKAGTVVADKIFAPQKIPQIEKTPEILELTPESIRILKKIDNQPTESLENLIRGRSIK